MSVRSIPLFSAGRATPFLRAQWVAKGALQPLPVIPLLDQDGTALTTFTGLWKAAFPTRSALPASALTEKDGTGTLEFWQAFQ